MKSIYVFDLDGTLVDSQAATVRAYEAAAPGVYLPEYWGQSAEDWGCPPDVHARKQEAFPSFRHLLKPGWALPMFQELLRRGETVQVMTSASLPTVNVLRSFLDSPPSVKFIVGARRIEKHLELKMAVDNYRIFYYDDAPVLVDGVRTFTPHDLPADIQTVVMAAGRGGRFRAVGEATPKPLLLYHGRQLVDYAYAAASELAAPVLVATPAVLDGLVDVPERSVAVHRTQPGPVASALLAATWVDEDAPVVFLDSDVVLTPGTIYDFAGHAAGSVATLVTRRGSRSGVYGGFHNDAFVEGSTDCEWCNVGAYHFPSFRRFRELAAVAFVNRFDDREVKFSDLLQGGLAVLSLTEWLPLGTPEELNNANR